MVLQLGFSDIMEHQRVLPIHYLTPKFSQIVVSKYKTILNRLCLTQYIHRKTRGEACLDHVISNAGNIHQTEVSEAWLNTDHLVVSCKIGKNKENQEILIKQWQLSNKDASMIVIIGNEDKSVDSKLSRQMAKREAAITKTTLIVC